MKHTLLFLSLIYICHADLTEVAFAQFPSSFTEDGSVHYVFVRQHQSGCIIAGQYSGTVNFSGTVSTANSPNDIFFVYFDSFDFSKLTSFFTITGDNNTELALNGFSSYYAFGSFKGNMTILDQAFSSNSTHGFVIFFDPNYGNCFTTPTIMGSSESEDQVTGLAEYTDTWVVGWTAGGLSSWGGHQIISNGGKDIAFCNTTYHGGCSYVVTIGGTGDDVPGGQALDYNLLYIVATIYSPSINISGTVLTTNGESDILLLVMDTYTRNFVFSKLIGGPGKDTGTGTGRYYPDWYVVGQFSGTVDFGGSENMTSVGDSSSFVVRYSTYLNNFNNVTLESQHTLSNVTIHSIVAKDYWAPQVLVYLAGTYQGESVTLPDNTILPPSSRVGSFAATLNHDNFTWGTGFPSDEYDSEFASVDGYQEFYGNGSVICVASQFHGNITNSKTVISGLSPKSNALITIFETPKVSLYSDPNRPWRISGHCTFSSPSATPAKSPVTTPSSHNSNSSGGDSALGVGSVIGIAVAGFVVMASAVGIAAWLIKSRKTETPSSTPDPF